MATTLAPITNAALGQLIGLDHSSVSRLRRGERRCSITVMARIEDVLGWTISAQYDAFNNGTFHQELERRLTAHHLGDYDTPAKWDTPAAL